MENDPACKAQQTGADQASLAAARGCQRLVTVARQQMLELLEGVAMKTTQTCGEEDRWSNGQLEHLGMHPCRPNITLQYDDLHSDAVDARGQATRMVWYMCECLHM
jgi:hypothetical protein